MPLPSAAFRSYPSRCKNVVWQKFKSFKDKAMPKTHKTGLGDTLKAAEAAWNKIDWNTMDLKKQKATTLSDAKTKQAKAKLALKNVEAAKTALDVAREKAMATKANTKLSTEARNQAETMANGLKSAVGWLNQIDISDFDTQVKSLGG